MTFAKHPPICLCLVVACAATAEVDAREVPAPPAYGLDKVNLTVYIDSDGEKQPVTGIDDWQKRREHILANMQLVMGPLPADDRVGSPGGVGPAISVHSRADQRQ